MKMTAASNSMPAPAQAASASMVITDEQLLERLKEGETQAGEELVRRYCEPLLRYLQRVGGSESLAEELHQQTWASVLEHIEKFDLKSSGGGFKAWLFRIA